MKNKEASEARRYDTPYRCRELTEYVYGGEQENKDEYRKQAFAQTERFMPKKHEYNVYFGEMHGHTNLSDGAPEPEKYFPHLKDNAKLDFGALTDHDHGGVGYAELYGEKWEIIKELVKKYYEPGKFTTLLAYERDSYPWYNNMVAYFGNHDADMLPQSISGEITKEELKNALERDDVLLAPHDTYHIEAGSDLKNMDKSLYTELFEIYSCADAAEYFGNPNNDAPALCEGGFFQDALRNGAKMGVIAGSDSHCLENGLNFPEREGAQRYNGLTAVLAKENTVEGIFEALKARRCYAFMGGRIYIDFRVNDHLMGEEITSNGRRSMYFSVEADAEVEKITIVKNCRDYIIFKMSEYLLFDSCENEEDIYYLRVELKDGRVAWTSPIWVKEEQV